VSENDINMVLNTLELLLISLERIFSLIAVPVGMKNYNAINLRAQTVHTALISQTKE
jgi:hypothetical protein